jgi:outer membrane protein
MTILLISSNVIGQDMSFEDRSSNYYLQNSVFSVNYNVSIPFGDLHEFIPTTGVAGFDAEFKTLVTDNIAVGGMLGYAGFYKKYDRDTYEFENGALTSTIFKYYYTVPMRIVADYFISPGSFVQPFVGLSTGVNYNERRLEVGFYSLEDKSWNFVVAPEAGMIIPFGRFSEWGFSVKARYNYQIYDRDNFNSLQYLDVALGFSYSY